MCLIIIITALLSHQWLCFIILRSLCRRLYIHIAVVKIWLWVRDEGVHSTGLVLIRNEQKWGSFSLSKQSNEHRGQLVVGHLSASDEECEASNIYHYTAPHKSPCLSWCQMWLQNKCAAAYTSVHMQQYWDVFVCWDAHLNSSAQMF